eukprot:Em0714g7a
MPSLHASRLALGRAAFSGLGSSLASTRTEAHAGSTDQNLSSAYCKRVVCVGIYPYLLPGVDSPREVADLAICAEQRRRLHQSNKARGAWLNAPKCCSRCTEEQTLGPLILGHHLSDILVALMQVSYDSSACCETSSPDCRPTERVAPERCRDGDGGTPREENRALIADCDRAWCAEALSGLLDRTDGAENRVSEEPQVASETCGRLLSELLMKKTGSSLCCEASWIRWQAQAKVPRRRGGAQNWKKCRALPRVIAHCPSKPIPQNNTTLFLIFFTFRHTKPDDKFLRVTVAIMDAMLRRMDSGRQVPDLSSTPNHWKLLCTAEVASNDQKAVGEYLQTCIKDLCKICGVLEVTSSLVPVLIRYLPVIFELSRVCDEQDHTDQSSALHSGHQASFRSPATAVLCFLISTVDSDATLKYLMSFATASEQGTAELKWVSPCWTLSRGSGPGKLLEVSTTLCNEDGLQEVDKMEGRASHVVSLLKSELKANRLAGKLCLMCLGNMERVLHKAIYKPDRGSDLSGLMGRESERISSVLLDLEGGDPTSEHMTALFLVASLCEHMAMEVMEQADIRQMLEVLLLIVTAYRDFVGSNSSSSSQVQGLLHILPDLDSLPGSVIPLSITIGLLSSIMGGARKVSREDRPLLARFLHPLEVISSNCPVPELQMQASELRICIATMGAVWSSELGTLGTNLTEKAKSTGKKATKSKLIEEIPVSAPASREHPGGVEEHRRGNKRHPAGVENECKAQLSAFQAALVDLQDPLLPIQAHGLLALAKLVTARDTETLACSSSLTVVFKENLRHTDSYVYLAAIDGLVALASTMPKDIVPLLCQEYVYLSSPGDPGQEKGISEKVQHVLKLGEALVRAARTLGDMLPHYSEILLSAILVNLRSPVVVVRTSALSNLADVCSMLHWSFGRIQNEVLGSITHILQTDKEPSARQGALLVLKLLIKGLSQDAIELLGGSLRDVYRLLKQVEATERDTLTQAHAQAALGELDSVMRAYLFPQETLTKKISILDPV